MSNKDLKRIMDLESQVATQQLEINRLKTLLHLTKAELAEYKSAYNYLQHGPHK